jgi:hypothetical protein
LLQNVRVLRARRDGGDAGLRGGFAGGGKFSKEDRTDPFAVLL